LQTKPHGDPQERERCCGDDDLDAAAQVIGCSVAIEGR
jgi:hypothetical protein